MISDFKREVRHKKPETMINLAVVLSASSDFEKEGTLRWGAVAVAVAVAVVVCGRISRGRERATEKEKSDVMFTTSRWGAVWVLSQDKRSWSVLNIIYGDLKTGSLG